MRNLKKWLEISMKKIKTPQYILKAHTAHMKRYGYVNYNRRVKPEWKEVLDRLLAKLKRGEINNDTHESSHEK